MLVSDVSKLNKFFLVQQDKINGFDVFTLTHTQKNLFHWYQTNIFTYLMYECSTGKIYLHAEERQSELKHYAVHNMLYIQLYIIISTSNYCVYYEQ